MAAITLDSAELRPMIQAIVAETIVAIGAGQMAVSEKEAAKRLGVSPCVLRDLRLAHKIDHTRMTRKRKAGKP